MYDLYNIVSICLVMLLVNPFTHNHPFLKMKDIKLHSNLQIEYLATFLLKHAVTKDTRIHVY